MLREGFAREGAELLVRQTMMQQSLQQAIEALRQMLDRVGQSLDDRQQQLLLKADNELEEAELESLRPLIKPMWKGFFYCAAEGHAFLPPQLIKEKFGYSLEENYPAASASFLRFATTYWTFKLVQSELLPTHQEKFLTQLLSKFETDIASVFFPTPGPMTIPARQREEAQRELIRESGAPIDIEDFIRGNPMLRQT